MRRAHRPATTSSTASSTGCKDCLSRRLPWRENARKLKVDPGKRAFQERLEEECTRSLEALNPLKARLAATDWLIDRVVYRLPEGGPTEEEIRIVEQG